MTTPRSNGRRLRACLRDVREELVHVDAAAQKYAAAPDDERAARWREFKARLDAEADGIDERFGQLAAIISEDDRLADLHSDSVTRIQNLWDGVKRGAAKPADKRPGAAELRQDLDRCVLEIGFLTVPQRANANLGAYRVGSGMDFHKEFADEIPSRQARVAILKWMRDHPRAVQGVVDVESGAIIKASASKLRRVASWLYVALAMGLAIVAAAYSPRLLALIDVGRLPEGATGADFVWAVVFAYAGGAGHVLVAALKQLRRADAVGDRSFTAIGNFTIWVHINEVYLLMYAIAIPLVAYVVMLSTGTIDNLTMVFVGFSIDSLLDVVLNRFDKAASRRTETIAAALG